MLQNLPLLSLLGFVVIDNKDKFRYMIASAVLIDTVIQSDLSKKTKEILSTSDSRQAILQLTGVANVRLVHGIGSF